MAKNITATQWKNPFTAKKTKMHNLLLKALKAVIHLTFLYDYLFLTFALAQ